MNVLKSEKFYCDKFMIELKLNICARAFHFSGLRNRRVNNDDPKHFVFFTLLRAAAIICLGV